MSKKHQISQRSMRRIAREDLQMKSLTLQKRQALSETQKLKRLERSKILLNELSRGTAGEDVWSDEKISTVEKNYNCRKDHENFA